MNDDHVAKTISTYNSLAKEYIEKFNKYPPKEEQDLFLSKLPKHASILDAGCGPGRDSKRFSDEDNEVTGIDLSDEFIAYAKHAVPKAHFHIMDLRDITLPSNSFDGIWACASLLHLKRAEIPLVLKNFYQLLKPKGVLFVSMKEGVGEMEGTSKTSGDNVRLFTYLAKDELTQYLIEAKFTVEKIYNLNQKDRWPERSSKIWIASFSRKK